MPTGRMVDIKATGLFTHPGHVKLPPGALRVAENCVIIRDNVISRRRGLKRYGDELSEPASALYEYLETLLFLEGSTLRRDSDGLGTWASYTGSFETPHEDVQIMGLEASNNFYFTTSTGLWVISGLSGTPVQAGIPQGLDTQLSLAGTGGSWFFESSVGYAHTWKRTDAQGNEKQGAPSFLERITNSPTAATWTRVTTTATVAQTAHGYTTGDIVEVSDSSDVAAITNGPKTITVTGADAYTFTCLNAGAASGTLSVLKECNVSVTVTVPGDVVAGDVLELWRTSLTAAAGDAVGDDYRLIITHTLTSAEKTAGTVTLLDDNDPVFLGEPLYTNAGEETRTQSNYRPPLARFIAHFEGHTWYLWTIQPHSLALQFLDIAGLVDGTSSLTFTDGVTTLTYTFAAAENAGLRQFKRWTSLLTLAENIEATMKSFQKIANRDTGNTLFTVHYTSGEDLAPGMVLLEGKILGADAISVIANNTTTGGDFTPTVPTSGTTLSSTNDEEPHGVLRSKFEQPEAVPRLNQTRLGKKNKGTTGAVALKEALLVDKEDGSFKISGRSEGSSGSEFVDDQDDPTLILRSQRLLGNLNDAAIAFTTQGVVLAGQGATAIVSRPQVETDLLRISKFQAFAEISHFITYESDHRLIACVPETSADSYPTIAYVWDYTINAWTTWRKPIAAGLVLSADDKLYLAHAVDPYILQERKSLDTTGNDYVDEDIPITITAVATTTHPTLGTTVSLVTFTYDYSVEMAAGFLLQKGSSRVQIDAVTALGGTSYEATCRRLVSGLTTGSATVGLPIPMTIEWAPVTLGDALSLKQFSAVSVLPEKQAGAHLLSFQADTQGTMEHLEVILFTPTQGWGTQPWGLTPWGDSATAPSEPPRTMVPREHQICRALRVRYRNVYAKDRIDTLELAVDVRPISTKSQRKPA